MRMIMIDKHCHLCGNMVESGAGDHIQDHVKVEGTCEHGACTSDDGKGCVECDECTSAQKQVA